MNKANLRRAFKESAAKKKLASKVQPTRTPQEVSPESISVAMTDAIASLKGTPVSDPYKAWEQVTNAVLDILALPDGQRDETKEFLLLLIETDPGLQDQIEKGLQQFS